MAEPYSGPGYISYRGRPQLQSESIEMSFDSGNKDVDVLLLGRAGHSAGADKVMFSVNQAIPKAGMEVDWVAVSAAKAQIDLTFTIAGRAYNASGDVRTVKVGTTTGNPNSVSFEFHGKLTQNLATG